MTERICVAVGELRKKYSDETITFEKWLNSEKNVYVGRKGRIFINKKIFHYPGSEWRNDFTVKEYGREECLKLYNEHILKKIKNKELDIETLRGKKLGCFCRLNEKCHVDILIKLLESSP